MSLVISLSQTLKGLHWNKIPKDNDDEVAARGILYLLIFQQLGQLVRWSWGYHVLLAPKERYIEEAEYLTIEYGQEIYTDSPEQTDPDEPLIRPAGEEDLPTIHEHAARSDSTFESGGQTPVTDRVMSYSKLDAISDVVEEQEQEEGQVSQLALPPNGPFLPRRGSTGLIMSFPNVEIRSPHEHPASGFKGLVQRWKRSLGEARARTSRFLDAKANAVFERLPSPMQTVLSAISTGLGRFGSFLWQFMNPPLWAMLVAILVASVPRLQHLFFDEGTFVENSVTRAIDQNGQVAVPLILVVLGANQARNTLPDDAL
jgi:predicted permease